MKVMSYLCTRVILAACLVVAGCGQTEREPSADWVFEGGKVFTAEPDAPWAEAVAIKGGRIVYVGSSDGAQDLIGAETQVVDVGAGLLIPGLMDSHTHIFNGSYADVGVNLSLADTADKLAAALETIRDDNPGTAPVYARGWQNHLFPAHGPLASQLDEVFGDRIVILGSVDGHSTWFSSRALREAGVDASFPDPKPGVSFFERDPLTNAPLGTAREGAGGFIRTTFIPGDKTAYQNRLEAWLPRAAAAGLTSVFDATASAPTEEDAYKIWQALDQSGALSLRVFGSIIQNTSADVMTSRFEQYREEFTGERLRLEALKIVADGVPEGHTAFLLTPYVDTPDEDYGYPMMSKPDLTAQITTYFASDIPVHVHAIGGAAVRMTLDAIADARRATGNLTVRATIAHMDFVSADDIPRFSELNVTAQTSIQWAARDPSYFNIGGFVGMQKVEEAYPIRSLMDAGANQSFGADWPASAYLSTYKPLELLEAAVTRKLPGEASMPARNEAEAISLEEAIIAMTRNTAIQLGELERLGTLAVGKEADLVLLANDLFSIDPNTIHSTEVRMTMVGGEVVHEIGR